MKKKLIALALSVLALTGCAPSNETETEININTVVDYRIANGFTDGNLIETDDGHLWEADGPDNYTGYVNVIFDAKGTEDVTDDEIIAILKSE